MENGAFKPKRSFYHKIRIGYYRHISDRRRYLRKPIRVKITEKTSGVFEHFASTNISAGGMFIKSDRPFAIGSNLDVEFTLPGEDEVIHISARVVRTVPPGEPRGNCAGMGIEFVDIDETTRKAIDDFVRCSGIS